jgi:hypothetical protein
MNSDVPKTKGLKAGLLSTLSVFSENLVLIGQTLSKVVPRDGVEPPTPAFSGLRSTA